ncbi:MAG TPA: 16S rRNA (adenine(1518)-N(6)/adenine(1519)-N(6))-dimethyltransferase RsmA [Pseudobdellovibrionaceae bacterium]|nr:16S rRNA (adenine(1518)-N(6)/adenine(1519)-N(6))-dimethyltransferase RsmA [Pseudobdellovibrionaceae bacterium]
MSRRSRLLERLQEISAGPKRSLGQNFLVADHVIEKIIAASAEGLAQGENSSRADRSESVQAMIEIGPGLGALTDELRKLGVRLTVIELDAKFAEYWRARGLNVVEADALRIDWLKLLEEQPKPVRLVANLPYQIAASLVIELSLLPEAAGLDSMILMFQKEVAQRIAARESSEHYGLLSVIAQVFWLVRTVSEAGPGDFHPPPRVASRVLAFQRRRPAALSAEEASRFLKFVKLAYSQRRKRLLKNLGEPQGAAAALAAMGFDDNARIEQLSPEQVLALFRAIR